MSALCRPLILCFLFRLCGICFVEFFFYGICVQNREFNFVELKNREFVTRFAEFESVLWNLSRVIYV